MANQEIQPAAQPAPEAQPADPRNIVNAAYSARLRNWIRSGEQLHWTATADPMTAYLSAVHAARAMDLNIIGMDPARGWKVGPNDPTAEIDAVARAIKCNDFDPQILRLNNVLRAVREFTRVERALFVLWNFDRELADDVESQNTILAFSRGQLLINRDLWRPVLFISPDSAELPPRISECMINHRLERPTIEEIRSGPVEYVRQSVVAQRPSEPPPGEDILESMSQAAAGLNRTDITRILSVSASRNHGIRQEILADIRKEKAQQVAKSPALKVISDSMAARPEDVCGMEVLIGDLRRAARAFTSAGRADGLDLPGGFIILGVPGTGKSRICTAIGHILREATAREFPVIRVDCGAVFTSLLGESERQWRNARDLITAQEGCVAWIDEWEKAMGAGRGETDGGTSGRVFADMLTWISDRQYSEDKTFIAVTMNDPTFVKPELMRRFRYRYFVDLPVASVRQEIFRVHLARRLARHGKTLADLDLDDKDWELLAHSTADFTGQEIENVVIGARERNPVPTFDDLTAEIGSLKNSILFYTEREKIERIREVGSRYKPVHLADRTLQLPSSDEGQAHARPLFPPGD